MDTLKLAKRRKFLRRLLFIFTTILLIVALSSMTLIYSSASIRVVPSPHCEGGDCCINSDCSCPNCEDSDESDEETGEEVEEEEDDDEKEELLPLEDDSGQEIFDEPVPLIAIGSNNILLFAPLGLSSWSIFNLVTTIAGIVFAILFILRAVRQKREENELSDKQTAMIKNSNSLNSEQLLSMIEQAERFNSRRRLSVLAVTYILSFGAALLLLLTQNFVGNIAVFDYWSLAHGVMFVGILICGRYVFTKYAVSIKKDGVVNV